MRERLAPILDFVGRVQAAAWVAVTMLSIAALVAFWAFVNPGWAIPVGVAVFGAATWGIVGMTELQSRMRFPVRVEACSPPTIDRYPKDVSKTVVLLPDLYVKNDSATRTAHFWFEIDGVVAGRSIHADELPADSERKKWQFDYYPNPKQLGPGNHLRHLAWFLLDTPEGVRPVENPPLLDAVLTVRHKKWVLRIPLPGTHRSERPTPPC